MAIVHKDAEKTVEVDDQFGTVIVRSTFNRAAVFIHRDIVTGGLIVASSDKMELGLHHGNPAIRVPGPK